MIDKFWQENDYHWEEYRGLQIVLRRGFAKAWCGYVGLAPGHPLHGKDYSERLPIPDRGAVDTSKLSPLAVMCETLEEDDGKVRMDVFFSVHGGITFASKNGDGNYPLGQPNFLWWFGFDCSHSGDLTPKDYYKDHWTRDGVYRDKEYVLSEAHSLADQLLAYATSHE